MQDMFVVTNNFRCGMQLRIGMKNDLNIINYSSVRKLYSLCGSMTSVL